MKFHFKTEAVVTALSLCVAVLASMGSMAQAYLVMVHNKLSVTPALEIELSRFRSQHRFNLELVNNGLGPARVKSVRFYVDGKPAGDDVIAVFNTLDIPIRCFNYSGLSGYYKVGDRRKVMEIIKDSPCSDSADAIGIKLARMAFDVEYESIYSEPFLLQSRGLQF